MKIEWRKQFKEFYLPKTKPELIYIPCFKFISINGKGDPNGEDFEMAVNALYSISYAIKMMPKKGIEPKGYFDYTVFPLEALWTLEYEFDMKNDCDLNKNDLLYKVMIRQPEFINDKLLKDVLIKIKESKPNKFLDSVEFGKIEDGLSVQILHEGKYDDEKLSFRIMNDFCKENNLKQIGNIHREIYLSDPRKTISEKTKTVLRYSVVKVNHI